MGDPKQNLWQEITQGAGKFLTYAAYIFFGVLAKLAFDSKKGMLTRRQMIYKATLSIFAGILIASTCENIDALREWAKVIVPVGTLMGEGIIGYLMTNVDWAKVGSLFLPQWIQNLFKKK